MSEPGFASLGPSLLARKGGAKPAMRPQVAPLVQEEQELAELADEQLEDLGWNDMGEIDSDEPAGSADVVPINAAVSAEDFGQGSAGPIVRRQQRRLEERVLADAAMTGPDDRESEYDIEDDEEFGEEQESDQDYAPLAPEPAPVAVAAPVLAPMPRPARAPVVQAGRRAAFTLRLDADRHLKLRLAATMQGVSAQALLTEALDAMLAEFDDLDVIANHLKRH